MTTVRGFSGISIPVYGRRSALRMRKDMLIEVQGRRAYFLLVRVILERDGGFAVFSEWDEDLQEDSRYDTLQDLRAWVAMLDISSGYDFQERWRRRTALKFALDLASLPAA